jgi:hypothetical protein
MEFAGRNLGHPPFGLMTPTKEVDLVKSRSPRKPLGSRGVESEIVLNEKICSGGDRGRTGVRLAVWDHPMDGSSARLAVYCRPFDQHHRLFSYLISELSFGSCRRDLSGPK